MCDTFRLQRLPFDTREGPRGPCCPHTHTGHRWRQTRGGHHPRSSVPRVTVPEDLHGTSGLGCLLQKPPPSRTARTTSPSHWPRASSMRCWNRCWLGRPRACGGIPRFAHGFEPAWGGGTRGSARRGPRPNPLPLFEVASTGFWGYLDSLHMSDSTASKPSRMREPN